MQSQGSLLKRKYETRVGRNRGCWSQTLGTVSGCPEPLRNQALSLSLPRPGPRGGGGEQGGGKGIEPMVPLEAGRRQRYRPTLQPP